MTKINKDIKPDYLLIPYTIVKDKNIPPSGAQVYSAIYFFSQLSKGKCIASNKSIARVAGVSKGTAANEISKLAEKNYINTIYSDKKHKRRQEIIPLVRFINQGGFHQMMNGVSSNDEWGVSSNDEQSNNNISNNSNIASQGVATSKEEKFSTKKYIKKMSKDNNKHIQIIGLYAYLKKVTWDNKGQVQSFIKRYARPAKRLKPYSIDRIKEVGQWLDDNANFKWTLETIEKYIDEDLDDIEWREKNL